MEDSHAKGFLFWGLTSKGAAMRISTGFCVLGASIATLFVLNGCNKKQAGTQNEILIGEYGSLTGATATYGQSTHKGIVMALDEINAKGGVLGRPIKVITEDDEGKPEEAQTV